MTSQEYIKKAIRTESKDYPKTSLGDNSPRIEHAILGIASEAGELVDNLKHEKYYSKIFDEKNLVEEAGDVMWYLALLCDELKISFEDVWEKNIAKLKLRFPEKFNEDDALNRDIDKERKIFE